MTTLLIGADHRGHAAATSLAERLTARGVETELVVHTDGDLVDYPEIAYQVAHRVALDPKAHAVLICGTGVGMAIAANKVKGIRAAVVHDELTAELSKSHLHANIVCLSADLLGERLIDKVVGIWLDANPGGPRHERRIEKIARIERGEDPRT